MPLPHQQGRTPTSGPVDQSFNGEYRLMRRVLAVTPTLARLGVGHLVNILGAPALPRRPGRQASAFRSSPRGWANERAEQATLPIAFRQSQAATSLGHISLLVLTSRGSAGQTPGWATAQDQLATLSTNTRHTVADISHMDFLLSRASAAISVTGIDDVITAVRTGKALGANAAGATNPSTPPGP